MLLENLRFHPGGREERPGVRAGSSPRWPTSTSNDAFGAAHRAHASVEGITHSCRGAAAGLLMEQELTYLGHALESPERPFVAILGGAKVSDKIEVIENLLGKVDRLIIGGAMAYTFFKSRGMPIGKSLVEDDKLDAARDDRARDAKARGVELALPVDHVVTDRSTPARRTKCSPVDDAAIGDRMGVDIGPKTIAAYEALHRRREDGRLERPDGRLRNRRVRERHQRASRARSRASTGTTIVGGGDSIAAIKKAGMADRITHISTGGGASLEFLGGRDASRRRRARGQVGQEVGRVGKAGRGAGGPGRAKPCRSAASHLPDLPDS